MCRAQGMSFVDKLAALRRLLGIDSSLDSMRAIAHMNVAMGIIAEGALPAQVNVLVDATGIQVSAATTPAATPAATLAATPAAAVAPATTTRCRKRVAEARTSDSGTPLSKKQRTLFSMMLPRRCSA